jgi:hypothetical protein
MEPGSLRTAGRRFAEYFESGGYEVSAPEWPRKRAGAEARREDPEELEASGLTEIVDHCESEIRGLDARLS